MSTLVQVEVQTADWYLGDAAELLFGVFLPLEVNDALKSDLERWVAVAGGEVVGYICWKRCINYLYWDLKWIAVSHEHHKHGIGRMLVDYMKAHVLWHNGSHIRVETPGDSPARKFYERCDFTLAAEYPDFYEVGRSTTVYTWRNPYYKTITIQDTE